MKKILLFVIIFFINASLFSNTKKIDSLHYKLNIADSIKKIELFIELSLEYVVIDTLKSLEFSNKAFELSDQLGKHKAQAIGNSGYIYYLIGNPEKSLKLLLNALTELDLENDLKVRANVLKNIGYVYNELKKYDRSLEYLNKALSLNEELGDKEVMAILHYNIGDNYELLAEYVKALESYFDCLKIYEELADQEGIADSYNVIGNIFQALGDFDKALEYYNKYLVIQKEIEDKSRISIAYNNIGIVYDDNKDYDKSLEYYFKALEIDEELNDKEGIATVTNNLGVVYYKLKEYDKALEYYQQSLSLSKELNNIWAIANTSNNIAELYLDLTQYAESFSYVNKGFEYAESIEVKDLILESFHIYSKLYSKTNNYQKAFEYFKRYTDLKDTLFTTSIRKVAEMQRIHETEKKKKEIELLQKDNMVYKLKIEKQKLGRWIQYLILIIVLASIFIIYHLYITKKKANQLLEKLVEKRTEKLQIEIIERKFIEESLRKSEGKYRTLVETIDEGVGNVDENENFILVNKAAANIFGYSREEMIGKNLKELTTPEEFQRVLYQTSIRKTGKLSRYELAIIKKDGEHRIITVTATPIIGDGEKYLGTFGIFHDITERKRAEEALKKEKEYYQSFVTSLSDWVWEMDLNGVHTYSNPAVESILGYNVEDVVGHHITEIWVDDSKTPKILKWLKNTLASGKGWKNFPGKFKHRNGSIIITESTAIPIFDSEHKLLGYRGIDHDITERKLAEETLRESEEKYRLVTDNMTDIVSMCDKNETFVYISPSCQTILGYDPENLIGLPVYTLIHKDDLSHIKALVQKQLANLENASAIFRMQHKDGYILWFESRGRILFDSNGKLKGAVFNTRDITKHKEMEKQLLRSERLAGVGELAAGIAHEIRNPLGTISAATQLYLGKYKLDKEQKELFEVILRNCEDVDKVIRELIDFTNPREISLELKDIGKMVDNILEHLYAISIIHKVQIIKNCPKNLPQILLDEKWLETVFYNCIINAFDSMPDGGVLTITVLLNHKNKEILITILDTGVGISKENLDKIFDPFFTTKQDGIGLGLFLVHQIIKAHNGRLDIESKAGKGTKVIISLPIPGESREKKRIEPQTNTDKHRQKKVSFKSVKVNGK